MPRKKIPGAGGAGARRENIDARTVPKYGADVNPADAVRAIEAAVAAEPVLDAVGVCFRRRGRRDVDPRGAYAPLSAEGVATAINFLLQCRPAASARFSSYGLKHAAERWGGRHGMANYITNGELIAAAISVGLKITRVDPTSPNVAVAVGREDLARLDPSFPWLRGRAS